MQSHSCLQYSTILVFSDIEFFGITLLFFGRHMMLFLGGHTLVLGGGHTFNFLFWCHTISFFFFWGGHTFNFLFWCHTISFFFFGGGHTFCFGGAQIIFVQIQQHRNDLLCLQR